MTHRRSVVVQGDIGQDGDVVVFLPPAGSITSPYLPVGGRLPPGLHAVHCELPGRGRLADERPVSTVQQVVERWTDDLSRTVPGRRLYLFGHSLGTLFAYEMAARFAADPVCEVGGLLISGAREPGHVPRTLIATAFSALQAERRLTDEEGDTEGAHLTADLRMRREYRGAQKTIFAPLALLCGRDDKFVRPEEMTAWKKFVTGPFLGTFTFDGGHDYHLAGKDLLASTIKELVDRMNQSPKRIRSEK
ncbi:alpha/beta fold hydrolase [Streptomyces sp. NPDC007346]|uniref:thioesterase II family protein n=1 Tax=Streptomyces sp. NPDC007346 TaxID=3154682 RepID=UPI0034532202